MLNSVPALAKMLLSLFRLRRRRNETAESSAWSEERIRAKYLSFRELLDLNSECLELMAGLQEDLQFAPPRRDVIGDRISSIFQKAQMIVGALQQLTGLSQHPLTEALRDQRNEAERYIAALQEFAAPRLSARLGEVDSGALSEAGGKAAVLGEIKSKLGLPVPDGYVLTTEAYRLFCGIPLWTTIRDALREADPVNLESLHEISAALSDAILSLPMPRAVEVAVSERALTLETDGHGLAVRSSAVGEGGEKTFAGQYVTLLNVPKGQVADAYRKVIAGRFSERALSYRLSTGLLEVDSPMAVLFLPVIPARASGIMYTRNPGNPKSKELWVTATKGLGLEIASGRMPADLFIVSRGRSRAILETHIVSKDDILVLQPGGGIGHRNLPPEEAGQPSLTEQEIQTLAGWGIRIEEHFKVPQDVEWVLGQDGKLWILQARSLALIERQSGRTRSRTRAEPLLSGGRAVYPGQVSGPAYLVDDSHPLRKTPEGAIVFLRRASPEIVQVLPRIAGLVAEWGNVAGHAAALLREFKVPSVFLMKGCFEKIGADAAVSLDAVQSKVFPGTLWQTARAEATVAERYLDKSSDPISRRVLALNLLDPSAFNFRPAGCKSSHDVLRYCHEKAVEAMFAVNDLALESKGHRSKMLKTAIPLNVFVLDLGGGLASGDPEARDVGPAQIVSRPFQSLWKGLSHPGVSWTREMPASLSDLASVMAGALTSQGRSSRALGDRSYLLVADEYMNFNSRLAYHFSLVDACLSDTPSKNYISFRFAGGGATRYRRNLRACLIEACLVHYGFLVDRRGDLLNAWYKKGPAEETAAKLDILGRLMACTSQLDMYMVSQDVMKWYVSQFLAGNYAFRPPEEEASAPAPGGTPST